MKLKNKTNCLRINKLRRKNTLGEGAKIELKIPVDDDEPEESSEPKRSEVNEDEDEDEPTCFLPSISLFSLYIYYSFPIDIYYATLNPQ